jgi:hypothetical protein
MRVAGTWRVSVLTRHFTLVLVAADGGVVTGSMTEEGKPQTLPIRDGRETGDMVEWKADVPGYGETAEFRATIAGDKMTGHVRAGLFAPAFRARRTKPTGASA